MAQVTTQTVPNGSGASVRSNMNNIFGALFSASSGASAPTTTVAGQLWFDTNSSPAVLKQRNAANTAWVTILDKDAADLLYQSKSAILDDIGGITGAQGDMLYYNGTNWVALAKGTSRQVLAMNSGATAPEWIDAITNGAEQATTSGTTFDFTGIPAESMFIKMKLSGVSLSSNAMFLVQLGTSGGIVTSGYQGGGGTVVNTTPDEIGETSGAVIRVGNSTRTCSGTLTFSRVTPGSHKWVASYSAGSIGAQYFGGCDIDLGAEATQIRLTSTDGSAFDAGAVNVSAGYFA